MGNMRLLTPAEDWAWMQQHAGLTAVIAVAAALALYALARAIRAATRRLHLDTVLRAIATPGTLIWEAQGTYVLARGMGMPVEIALAGCTITSTAVVVLAHQAHRHYQRHRTLGPAGRYTWYVAAPMATAVALTQHTIAYGFARVVVPLMAVLLWYSQYAPDEPSGQRRTRKRGRWIWTPERALVAAGLLAPTTEDLAESNATLRTRKLKRHGNGLHHGPAWLRAWHGARLRRIAEHATDDEVTIAQQSVTRVHTIEAATAPTAGPAIALPSGWRWHPFATARRATAASVQFAEQAAELARELATLRERTDRTEQAFREQFAAQRTEAELVITELREQVTELTAELAVAQRTKPEPDRTDTPRRRGNPQATTTLVSDEQLATKLWVLFERRMAEGGSLPTRYWVETNGQCFARQAERVRELLASRWTEQGAEPTGADRTDADEPEPEQTAI